MNAPSLPVRPGQSLITLFRAWPWLGGLLLIAVLLLAGWWRRSPALIEFSGPTMGSRYTVRVSRLPAGVTVTTLQTGVTVLLADINRRMSTYDPDSELSRFNRQTGTDWVAVSPELVFVVKEAQRVSELTDGAFDVTIGPVVNLWGFGPDPRADRIPSEEAIRQAQTRVGYQRLHTRDAPPALRKVQGDLYVDLSGIVPGYAADRVATYLEGQGIQDYLVDLSGEFRLKGQSPQQRPWRIAIEQPQPGERQIERILELSDTGLSTSGNYRNFFEQDGQRYGHVMDPKTGRPIRQELMSVTVIAASAAFADALATGLLVLGPERGLALAESRQWAVIFVRRGADGRRREESSHAFARYRAP